MFVILRADPDGFPGTGDVQVIDAGQAVLAVETGAALGNADEALAVGGGDLGIVQAGVDGGEACRFVWMLPGCLDAGDGALIDGRQIGAEEFSGPPGAGLFALLRRGVAVAIEQGADGGWGCVREGVGAHEFQDGGVVREKTVREAEEPKVVARNVDAATADADAEGQKPDHPVEAEVVGSDLRWAAVWVAGLALELVGKPGAGGCGDGVCGAFNDDLVALFTDGAEGAVGIDQVIAVVAVVHRLVF